MPTHDPAPLTAAEYRALTNAKPPGKATAAAAAPRPVSPAVLAKEQHARAAVVGVGMLAWVNSTFGLPVHLRKYRLLDAGQAAELDTCFFRITGTRP